MNKKFSYEIDERTSLMKTNNYSEEELNLIISERFTRIVDNASSIKYDNKYYIPINPKTGEVTCFMKKTECKFIITYNSEYWYEIEGNYYQLVELEDRDTTMKKEIDNNNLLKRKNIFHQRIILGESLIKFNIGASPKPRGLTIKDYRKRNSK